MEKVLIVDAGIRRGFTSQAVQQIAETLAEQFETETVSVRSLDIRPCSGCCLCLSTGSAACPHHGDAVAGFLQQLLSVKGVVWVIPNYSLQVPAQTKMLLDRLAFVFHRPRLFGKVSWPIVVQGVYGGNKITRYLNDVLKFWGAATVPGTVLQGGIVPAKAKDQAQSNQLRINKGLRPFLAAVRKDRPPRPSLFRVVLFRATRSSMKHYPEALPADKKYYESKGWFDSAYYYPTYLNPFKRLAGTIIDRLVRRGARKAQTSDAA